MTLDICEWNFRRGKKLYNGVTHALCSVHLILIYFVKVSNLSFPNCFHCVCFCISMMVVIMFFLKLNSDSFFLLKKQRKVVCSRSHPHVFADNSEFNFSNNWAWYIEFWYMWFTCILLYSYMNLLFISKFSDSRWSRCFTYWHCKSIYGKQNIRNWFFF